MDYRRFIDCFIYF